ncbi:MAG: hypothetical protein H8E66_05185 [Planctomycetes bacterium]|nr:hypothetical protein [Planctomycetota bacterium]
MASLAADAASLFRAWWYRDRIRSSPREGKLLRLSPGAVLCANGSTVEVQQRDVIETSQGSVLRYRCCGDDSPSELWVTFAPVPLIVWCCNRDEQRLAVDEIEVWSEGR